MSEGATVLFYSFENLSCSKVHEVNIILRQVKLENF